MKCSFPHKRMLRQQGIGMEISLCKWLIHSTQCKLFYECSFRWHNCLYCPARNERTDIIRVPGLSSWHPLLFHKVGSPKIPIVIDGILVFIVVNHIKAVYAHHLPLRWTLVQWFGLMGNIPKCLPFGLPLATGKWSRGGAFDNHEYFG